MKSFRWNKQDYCDYVCARSMSGGYYKKNRLSTWDYTCCARHAMEGVRGMTEEESTLSAWPACWCMRNKSVRLTNLDGDTRCLP